MKLSYNATYPLHGTCQATLPNENRPTFVHTSVETKLPYLIPAKKNILCVPVSCEFASMRCECTGALCGVS